MDKLFREIYKYRKSIVFWVFFIVVMSIVAVITFAQSVVNPKEIEIISLTTDGMVAVLIFSWLYMLSKSKSESYSKPFVIILLGFSLAFISYSIDAADEFYYFPKWMQWTEDISLLISAIVITIGIIILMKSQNEHLEKLDYLARIDKLTGLYNRFGFAELSSNAFEKAKKEKIKLSIIVIDINNFKKINDLYGHFVGDNALELLAKVMKRVTRDSDISCRWGGDEFIVLIQSAGIDIAEILSRRIKMELENNPIKIIANNSISVEITTGITAMQKNDVSIEQMINRADHSMLKAKKEGKLSIEQRTKQDRRLS